MKTLSDRTPNPKRQILTLIMTERCNLHCSYCYEDANDFGLLSSDLAIRQISEAFTDTRYDELEIDFFGGEPFLAFKNIVAVCEWLWSVEQPKPYLCFVVTNGTLVHGKIKQWVSKHADRLILGLSLDGTPAMHDCNRTGSYSKIDIALFKELWPFQPVKMTVSKETLPDLASGIAHIHELGFKVVCAPAYGIKWEPSDHLTLSRELRKLADYYIQQPNLEPCNIIAMPIQHALDASRDKNYCGAGSSLNCVDKSGNKVPCQAFLPMSTGKTLAEIQEIVPILASANNMSDPKCKDCFLLPVCPTCYGINFSISGDPFARDVSLCEFSKIRAKATAYLLSEMIVHRDRGYVHLKDKREGELFYMVKAIKRVNETSWQQYQEGDDAGIATVSI
jgi:uncharacterized protein